MKKDDVLGCISSLLALVKRGRFDVDVNGANQITAIITRAEKVGNELAKEVQDESGKATDEG